MEPITHPSRLLSPVARRKGTLKEFFDLTTFCGDFRDLGHPIKNASNLNTAHPSTWNIAVNCGARNWRVIRWLIFARNEYIIICQKCGTCYAVQKVEETAN